MTRILYNKCKDNILVSKENFKLRGQEYQVHIYLNEMQFTIVELHDEINPIKHSAGHAKTVADLKIKAKKALTDLGVKFKSESRNRNLP